MTGQRQVKVARIYDDPSDDDGVRVLVDRLWPRGMSKAKAQLDDWRKDVAPSTELRKWYGHREEHFDEFRRRYLSELGDPDRAESLKGLRDLAATGPVTLLTATKRADISEAAVLAELLLVSTSER